MEENKDINPPPEDSPSDQPIPENANGEVGTVADETPVEDASPDAEVAGVDDPGDVSGASAEEKEMAEMPAEDSGGPGEPAEDGDSQILSQESIDAALQDLADSREVGDLAPDLGDEPIVRQADFQQLSVGAEKKPPPNIDLLMDVELPVSIELGRTRLHVADILSLGHGSVVELDKLVGEPVDLLVNQKCVARGEVVVVDESFGLRITQLISPEERVKNLQ